MGKEDILKNIENNIAIENFKSQYKKQNRIIRMTQKFFTLIICCLSVTGIVFAKEISTKIYEDKYGSGAGVAHAIDEGYIENTEMEYQETVTKTEDTYTGETFDDVGIKIKVNDFMMDDFNLSLTFDLEFDDNVNNVISVKEMSSIFLSDMIITDENNNILYHLTENNLIKYLEENNLDTDYENTQDYVVVNCGVNSFPESKRGNKVKLVYNIYCDGVFPKSKKLIIHSNKVNVSKEEACFPGDGEIMFNGKWDIELDVPEKMYNRTTIEYAQKSTTNPEYNIDSAVLYDCGMMISGKFKAEKIPERPKIPEREFYDSLPTEDELRNDSEISTYIFNLEDETPEIIEYREKTSKLNEFQVEITNKLGKEYELTQGPNANGGSHINAEGYMEFSGMYDITKYDENIDEIILNITYRDKTEKIVLEKKGE